jgi:hypothetical protein
LSIMSNRAFMTSSSRGVAVDAHEMPPAGSL